MMRRILLLAALACGPVLHAQILSVYGTYSPVRVSNVVDGNNATGPGVSTTSFWSQGIGGGATFNFLQLGPIKLGFDLRGSTKSGGNGADLVLGGIRLGVKPPLIRIKPYIQASAGYFAPRPYLVNSPLPAGTVLHNKYIAWEILGGIDYPLFHFVDFRVIEIGGGQGYYSGSSSSASGNQVSLLTLSTGLVVHF